jgi:hypothetical protein
VNIHTLLKNSRLPRTLLLQKVGGQIDDAIARLSEGGFGVVAGTGVGKTAAIRHMCHKVLGPELNIDVVTLEHDATAWTWKCNVVVVTPGVLLNWLKAGRLSPDDLVVLDEVHQTSEHLELAMALAKHIGCTFVWMSATIDPEVYRNYLNARVVIRCEAFDPNRKARVKVIPSDLEHYLEGAFSTIAQQNRGVAVFVPTRAMAEGAAAQFDGKFGVHTGFYHGGEPAEKLRPYLTGDIPRPFAVFMTAAGSSSLNVVGLNEVVIVDEYYTEVVTSAGVRSLERRPLTANLLSQMGGRVNGRAENGRVIILSHRTIDFHSLVPTAPKFVLGGDPEQLALTCARMGIDALQLDLIGGFNSVTYERVMQRFISRGLIEQTPTGPRLTELGKQVERLPMRPAWGEMLVNAQELGQLDLLTIVAVCACVNQLRDLTRQSWNPFSFRVPGSDHLTIYNIITKALADFGYVKPNGNGVEYGLRGNYVRNRGGTVERGEFAQWCEDNGLVAKEVKNALFSLRSIFRQLKLRLPEPTEFAEITSGSQLHRFFIELLAGVGSLDYVYAQQHSQYGFVFAGSKVQPRQSVMGTVRHWKDRRGYDCASIDGTDIPLEVIVRYARITGTQLLGMTSDGERVRVSLSLEFAGLRLYSTIEMSPEQTEKFVEGADLTRLFAEWLAWQVTCVDIEEAKVVEVLVANDELQRQAIALNREAGTELFTVWGRDEITDFYQGVLAGARCISEITNPEVLRLPQLDPALVERAKQGAAELADHARSLRDEVYDLLAKHKDVFSDGLYDRLDALDVSDEQLPTTAYSLQLWVGRAKAAIAEAQQVINELRQQPQTVSADALEALKAQFAK